MGDRYEFDAATGGEGGAMERLKGQMRRSVDVGALFEPRVAVTITMAATKAGDMGFVIETHGAPSREQVDAAIVAADAAAMALMEKLGALQKMRDSLRAGQGDK